MDSGKPRSRLWTHAALAAVLLIAWGGCSPKGVGPLGPAGTRLTWEEMTAAQRREHMRQTVMPLAAGIFQAWRPECFAAIDCRLCHGLEADLGTYRMPTDHLPRLSGALLLGPEFASHPATTRLKLDRLVPAMAEALGVRTFSLVTRRGFGCYSCHWGPAGPMFGN